MLRAMSDARRYCRIAACAVVGFAPALASAQVCIPPGYGVPGLGGAPVWWDKNGNGAFPEEPTETEKLDDPRWQGAVRRGIGTGTVEDCAFRAVYSDDSGARYVTLSWQQKVVPESPTAEANILYVGIAGTKNVVVIRLNLNSLSPVSASGNWTPTVYQLTGTTWNLMQQPPAWVTVARAWVGGSSWAFNLRVPIGASLSQGVDLGDPFKMWYQMTVPSPYQELWAFKWPASVADVTTDPITYAEVFPDPQTWGEFRFSTGPTDSRCPSSGVSLAATDIGTEWSPRSLIRFAVPPATQPINVFHARPKNNGPDIAASQLHARFRLANWGSQPDPNQVAAGVTLWDTVPGGGNVLNAAAIPQGTQGDLTFSWQMTPIEAADYLGPNPRKSSHACMLVEMSGPGLYFDNDSVYTNMDFVQSNSPYRRDAEISVVGLKRLPGTMRRVYLYLQVRNMPERLREGQKVPTVAMHELEQMRRRGATPDEIMQHAPTYIVHVFHETGRKLRIGRKDYPILNPQGSFGYFVATEGTVKGWRTRLTGAREIAPFYYVMRVRQDGKAPVRTLVDALRK